MTWAKTLDINRASGIIIQNNNLLVIHRIRDNREYWVLPGGGVEEGESIKQALDREMKEELGIKVQKKKFLFTIENTGRSEYYFLITEYEGVPQMGGPELERMSDQNQYILEEKDLSELSKINLLPKDLNNKLAEYLK